MKVWKPGQVHVEIGPLDCYLTLQGMNRRRAMGLRSTCMACRKPIEGDQFAGGFKSGHPNLVLHVACVPEGTPPAGVTPPQEPRHAQP